MDQLTTPKDALVRAEDVTKAFLLKRTGLFEKPRSVKAVDSVSFDIPPGTTFGLVGESGSGKTTVAKMLLKLEAPTSGRMLVGGADIFQQTPADERAYRRTVQTVLQDPYGALSPRLRVGTIVAEPLMAQGADREAARVRSAETLQRVGLPASAVDRYPHQFSGGQRQRIAIARALTVNPRLLVLDEPVSALDVSIRAQVLKLLREMQADLGLTYLFIGHDLAIVRYLSDHVGVMYFGRVVEIGPAARVLRRPLHPYTRRLVDVARADAPLHRPKAAGSMPSPLAPPSGCQFRTRCIYADERCREEAPPLAVVAGTHKVACHHSEAIEAGQKAETGPQPEISAAAMN